MSWSMMYDARISWFAVLGGIFFLPLDIWPRLFLAMSAVFLVTSSFTLAKVIRDQQEAPDAHEQKLRTEEVGVGEH